MPLDFNLADQPAPTVNITPLVKQPELDVGKWNQDVLKSAESKAEENKAKPFDPRANAAFERSLEESKVKIENDVADAGLLDKIKAVGESFKKTNDFVAIKEWADKPDFEKDQTWIDTVSNFENVDQLVQSSGLSASDAEKIAKTVSYEDYIYTVGIIKKQASVNEDISHKIGSTAQAVGMVGGAILGLDIPTLFIPYVGEARLAKKISDIGDIHDAIKVQQAIDAHKAIMTASNISLSAAISTAQTVIHDDRSLMDGIIGFISLGGVNQYILNKSFGKMGSEYDNIMSHLRVEDELYRVNPNILPRYVKNPLLGYSSKEEESIIMGMRSTGKEPIILPSDIRDIRLGAKSDIVKGNIAKIDSEIASTNKKIESLTKRMNNPTVGKKLLEKTALELSDAKDKLKMLTTGRNKIQKASSIGKAINEVKNIVKNNGLSDYHAKMANAMVGKLDDSMKSIERNMNNDDIVELGKTAINKDVGEKLAVKTINGKVVAGKIDKLGKFKKFASQNKVLTALTVATMAATSASAFEGGGSSDSSYRDYLAYALLTFFGGYVAHKKISGMIVKSEGIKKSAGEIIKDVSTSFIEKELQFTPDGEKIGKAYAAYNKSLIEMGFPFRAMYYKGDEKLKQLAKDIFYDPDNTRVSNVETMKIQRYNNMEANFYSVFDKAYKSYYKDLKQTFKDKIDYVRKSNSARRNFNLEVTNAIENKSLQTDARVREVAENTRKILVDIGQRASAAGVKDFRALDDTYFPRITKHSDYYSLAKIIDGDFSAGNRIYDETFNNYVEMYSAAHPSAKSNEVLAVAKNFVDSISDESNRNIIGGVGDILGAATARAMERIPLDLTKWRDINVVKDGVRHTITLDTLMERDVEKVVVSYANAMEGHIALAEKGYKSFTEAFDIVGKQSDKDLQRIGTIKLNQIIGRQNFDSTTTAAQASKIVSNATMPMSMPLSAIMQIKEAGGTVIRSSKNWIHFKDLVSNLVDVIRNRGSDDAVTAMFMEMDSRGVSIMTNKLHTRVFDDGVESLLANQDNVISLANSASMKARDMSMIMYMIAPITDWIQRTNARMNGDLLARIAFGKATLTKTEMEAYGITSDTLSMAREVLRLNSKGFVTKESIELVENNPKAYDELRRVIFNMGQTQMLSPMIGTTPAVFHESALGSAMGNLMGFAFNSYATYGANSVKGLSRAEPSAMFDSVLWFASMYAAQELKDSIKGNKERTEEEKIRMALMQMPLTAPLAIPSMIGGSDIQKSTGQSLVQHAQSMVNLTEAFGD